MKNLHLKFFYTFCLLLGVLFTSCKHDASTHHDDIPTTEAALPAKKIAEQYSSPEQVPTEETAEPVLANLEDDKSSASKNTTATAEVETTQPKEKSEDSIAEPVKKVDKKLVKKRYAELEFDSLFYDFGEIMQGDKIEHKFTFTNTGKAPLTITKADATCGCAVPSIPFIDIMPGEKGYIGIMYNSVGKEGEEYPEVTIFSNAKKNPNQVLKLKGFVKVPEKKAEQVDSLKATPSDTSKTEVGNSN